MPSAGIVAGRKESSGQVWNLWGPTCLSFCLSGISVELSSNTIFQMNPFFPTSLFHCPSFISVHSMRRVPINTQNLFIKNFVFIFTCVNFSHLQSTLQLMQCTYWDIFSTAQNSFWTCWFWCILVLLLLFVSPLPCRQNIFLWGFFSSEEQEKSHLEEDKWIGRVGHGGHAVFG